MTIETRERAHAEAVARWQKQQQRERDALNEKWAEYERGTLDARKEQERVADWCDSQHRALDTRTQACEQRERDAAAKLAILKQREAAHIERVRQDTAELARDRTTFNEEMKRREAAFGFGISLLEEVERRNAAQAVREARLEAAEAAHDARVQRDTEALEQANEAFLATMRRKGKALKAWADGLVGEDKVRAIAQREAALATQQADLDLKHRLLQSETQAWRDEQSRAKELIRTASRQRSRARDMIRSVQIEARRRRLPVPDMRDG